MDVWNTYAEWDEARCLARISLLQDQISAGATFVIGPGGAAFAMAEKTKMEIWELRCRAPTSAPWGRPQMPPQADRSRIRIRMMRVEFDRRY